ncbi:hypothetical protein RDI58_027224 [Solanum bulbocastanum]|uniref:ABC transmembrane type-1 domain-containing protein n=1 Tax=Solanum bulbocastanum TaxID=147425 RepID=A0AAN8SUZ6_SOLBU
MFLRQNGFRQRPYKKTSYLDLIWNHEGIDNLERSSLVKDLEMLPFGGLTEIGERGNNLSGGQKQRVQLAHALYQDPDIYLLDDPFSAVDAHTSTSLFNDYVMGALSRKTVLLVTHQVEFLPSFDSILLISSGKIMKSGTFDALLSKSEEFQDLVNAQKTTFLPECQEVYVSKRPKAAEIELDNNVSSEERDDVVKLGLDASKSVYSILSSSLFFAPMSFFDSTPLGRMLSPVSSDLSIVDIELPFLINFTVGSIIISYSTYVILCFVSPEVVLVIVLMNYESRFFFKNLEFIDKNARLIFQTFSVTE